MFVSYHNSVMDNDGLHSVMSKTQPDKQKLRAGASAAPKSFDALLLAVGQNKDRAAFMALFDYFAPRIKSYLLKGGLSLDEADELAQESEDASVFDQFYAQELSQEIDSALEDLSPDQISIIKKAYYEDKPHAQIADETGLPLGTVKSRIRLAMQKLRKTLNASESNTMQRRKEHR